MIDLSEVLYHMEQRHPIAWDATGMVFFYIWVFSWLWLTTHHFWCICGNFHTWLSIAANLGFSSIPVYEHMPQVIIKCPLLFRWCRTWHKGVSSYNLSHRTCHSYIFNKSMFSLCKIHYTFSKPMIVMKFYSLHCVSTLEHFYTLFRGG